MESSLEKNQQPPPSAPVSQRCSGMETEHGLKLEEQSVCSTVSSSIGRAGSGDVAPSVGPPPLMSSLRFPKVMEAG